MAYPPDPLDVRVPPPGPSPTQPPEKPSDVRLSRRSHSIDVARSYVEGLERDREHLRELEQKYDRLIWELIQISAYAKALYVALHGFAQGQLPNWERVEELLNTDRRAYSEIWNCPCGHHRYDHDEDGQCEYLACRKICGK